MGKKLLGAAPYKPTPPSWAKPFKQAMRVKGMNLAKTAEKMNLSESTLRSWTNGTREINLADFLDMCAAAGVDAEMVLFGDRPTKEEVSKRDLQLAAKIGAIRDTRNGQAALTLIENTFATVPTSNDVIEKAFKTKERPRIGGVISRPTLFNDDFTGPRK